jgi:serine/threonine protein kinase
VPVPFPNPNSDLKLENVPVPFPNPNSDLKLENVLLTDKGVCKLCDFGSCTTRVLDCATASRKE